jgi:NAD(P)-dependent dehydrogenase (short-subunit alcohol dehydrogenase family)
MEILLPTLIRTVALWFFAGQFDNHVWRLVLLGAQYQLSVWSMHAPSNKAVSVILYAMTAVGIWWMPHFANFGRRKPRSGCVFVTGCDSGMGQATVVGFAQSQQQSTNNKYDQIFAGCFNKVAADKHFDTVLTAEQRKFVTVVALDVTSDQSVADAAKTVQAWMTAASSSLMGLVQYHGVAFNGPSAYMPISMYQRQLDVNFVGSVRVVQAFLPLLKDYTQKNRNARARIVLTGTGGGPCSPCPPLLTAYMSSKFALEAYAQSLRQELYMTNATMDVSVINPGFVKPTLLMAEGLKLTEAMWKACEANLGSPKAKQEYGAMMDHFLEYSSLQPGTHVSKVVEAAEDALLSPIPKSSYKVGIDSKLAPIVGLMPTGMREWIARNGIYGVLSPAGTVKGYKV